MRHESSSILELDGKEVSEFTPSKPREKWLRKRTHVKIRVGSVFLALTSGSSHSEMFPLVSVPVLSFVPQNVTANHRVNDTVFTEDGAQMVMGRFMYGPLDMVTLTGEKVKLPRYTIAVWAGRSYKEGVLLLFPADRYPHHDPAPLWRVGPLPHRAHQQQRTRLLRPPGKQKAGHRGVPRQNGGQVTNLVHFLLKMLLDEGSCLCRVSNNLIPRESRCFKCI